MRTRNGVSVRVLACRELLGKIGQILTRKLQLIWKDRRIAHSSKVFQPQLLARASGQPKPEGTRRRLRFVLLRTCSSAGGTRQELWHP